MFGFVFYLLTCRFVYNVVVCAFLFVFCFFVFVCAISCFLLRSSQIMNVFSCVVFLSSGSVLIYVCPWVALSEAILIYLCRKCAHCFVLFNLKKEFHILTSCVLRFIAFSGVLCVCFFSPFFKFALL